MVHPHMFPKVVVCIDVKPNEVNDDVKLVDVKDEANGDIPVVKIDVGEQFRKQEKYLRIKN